MCLLTWIILRIFSQIKTDGKIMNYGNDFFFYGNFSRWHSRRGTTFLHHRQPTWFATVQWKTTVITFSESRILHVKCIHIFSMYLLYNYYCHWKQRCRHCTRTHGERDNFFILTRNALKKTTTIDRIMFYTQTRVLINS